MYKCTVTTAMATLANINNFIIQQQYFHEVANSKWHHVFYCLLTSSSNQSPKVLIMFLIIGIIVSKNFSESNPLESHVAQYSQSNAPTNLFAMAEGDIRFKQCKTDTTCREYVSSIILQELVLCVDSFCKCAPNYQTKVFQPHKNNQSNSEHARMQYDCIHFECHSDEDCQEYDHHRVCHENTGICVCRQNFLEDGTNGQKCVAQYGIMPAYSKQSRKFLNKNRISYRENIEHWPKKQTLWLQYFSFIVFFVGQICILVHYVAKRRKKMIQQMILTKNLVNRQNSDQLPIAERGEI